MTRSDYYVYTYSYQDGTPFYVGKGTGRRWRVHLCDALAGRNKDKFAVRAVRKLLDAGTEPVISKIVDGVDNEFACFVEEEFIRKYGRRDLGTGVLTNCTAGGDSGAPALSEEAKSRQTKKLIEWTRTKRVVDAEYAKRISDGLRARYKLHPVSLEARQKLSAATKGEKNPFYGKSHSQETIELLSKINTGKTLAEETKAKQRLAMKDKHIGSENPFYGKSHTEESKNKIAKAQLKVVESLKKSGEPHWNLGRKHSDEVISKLKVKRTCPHCGTTGGGSAMFRYHFDKCKQVVI